MQGKQDIHHPSLTVHSDLSPHYELGRLVMWTETKKIINSVSVTQLLTYCCPVGEKANCPGSK